jgi:hypothetical protein
LTASKRAAPTILMFSPSLATSSTRSSSSCSRASAPCVVGERVSDLALRRLAVRALGGLAEAALAQQLLSGLDVAACLDEGALAVHHPRAGQLAELLDESG